MAESFVQELRRRKVVRVGVVYALVGAAVIGVASDAFPNLGVPDWAVTLVIALVILGFPLAVVLSWMFDLTSGGIERTGPALAEQPSPTATAASDVPAGTSSGEGADSTPRAELNSIAVLSFADMSPEKDQEYFCDGIAEEIIDALVSVEGLDVAARTSGFSYKGSNKDVKAVGAELGVAVVLEGSVRKAGDQLRITAQLVKVDDGYHLWSEKYDRHFADVFKIQEDIAQAVVARLREALGADIPAPKLRAHSTDPEAYELYLQGRYYWERRHKIGLETARDLFGRALERDPDYALAMAGLAEAWVYSGYYDYAPPREVNETASKLLSKALELEPMNADIHRVIGLRKLWLDWDFDGAEFSFLRALELNPSAGLAHTNYGYMLSPVGRFEDAVRQADIGLELEPLSTAVRSSAAAVMFIARNFEGAVETARDVLTADPDHVLGQYVSGVALTSLGRYEEGLEHLDTAVSASHGVAQLVAYKAWAHACAGQVEEARTVLATLEDRAETERIAPIYRAWVLAELGDTDSALDALDAAYDERTSALHFLGNTNLYRPLHGHPRFEAIRKKIGIPDYEI